MLFIDPEKNCMKHFSLSEVQSWERFYRSNFINSLSGFKSATLIASINKNEQPNLAIFSNIVHIGADPALVGFINRPRAAAPHTLQNIEDNGWYSMNHIHPAILEKAHQTSAKYAQEDNEFDATGLSIEYKQQLRPPFVKESSIQYCIQLEEIVPIKQNGTFLVIGAIRDVFIEDEHIIEKDGFLSIERTGSICSLGIDAYYQCSLINRFAYAKPDQPTTTL